MPTQVGPRSGAQADAPDQLAQETTRRWKREEEQLRIHSKYLLPVRWQPLSQLAGHPANIHRASARAISQPMPPPGQPDAIAGTYRQIDSGRLVVLGRAGSGKTALTLRFVLD